MNVGTSDGRITDLFREDSDNFIGNFFQETNAHLEYSITSVRTAEKTCIHFFQWNVLETEQTSGVVISDDDTIHITYSNLKAEVSNERMFICGAYIARILPIFQESRSDKIVIFSLKTLHWTLKSFNQISRVFLSSDVKQYIFLII